MPSEPRSRSLTNSVGDSRPRTLKRWLSRLAVLLLTGVLALNVLAYRHARSMMRFSSIPGRTAQPERLSFGGKLDVLWSGVNLPRPASSTPPTSLGPSARAVLIPGPGKIHLGAWHCSGGTNSPTVLLFHGYGGEKAGTVSEAKAFLELGMSVLLVDFRGSGDSSEAYTTVGFDEAEDVAAAVRYARAELGARTIVLYGQSMGAAAVLRAVHSLGVAPDAVILESVFDRLLSTVRHRFEALGVPSFPSAELLVFWGGHQAGFNGFAHDPVKYAAGVSCPVLFLHGADDPRARAQEARRVYDAVPGTKRFHEFTGVGHATSIGRYPEAWRAEVGSFLKESLGRPLAAPSSPP